MDFELNPQQKKLKSDAIAFARSELNEGLAEREHACDFPRELWQKCADYGLLGLCVPKQYGGSEYSLLDTIVVMEGIGYGCRDNGLTFTLNAQMWSSVEAICQFANEQQKERYLPGILKGELLGAFGMTEELTGSDCFALTTRAEQHNSGYILNGKKQLITFAPVADFALVFASTNPKAGRWGISTFIVDTNTKGLNTSATQEKMGLRTAPIGEIVLHNCFVPASQMLGPEGAGASIFNASQEMERSSILASQVGTMEYQLEQAITHCKSRKQFGHPIGKFQSVSNRVVDMKLRLETARLLLYKTAWLRQHGKPNMLESALTNLYLAEGFVQSSLDAIALRGGRGYLTENNVERDLRDAIGATLYGGTSDIQRNIAARLLGL